MKDLIDFIARSLVDDPTQVKVQEFVKRNTVRVRLQVAKEDMGRVIGKGGRVANAMRTLLKVAAAQTGKHVSLDIDEPQ